MLFFNKAISEIRTFVKFLSYRYFLVRFKLNGKTKQRTRLALVIFLCTAGVHLSYLQSAGYADRPYQMGVVAVSELKMTAQPKLNAPILKVLTKGSKIEIHDTKKSWVKIVHEGRTGYIQDEKQNAYALLETGQQLENNVKHKQKIHQLKQEAQSINRKIEKRKAEIITFTQKERSVLNKLNEMDLSLNKSKKLASLIRTDLALLSKKITDTRNATKSLEGKIRSSEQYIAKRLVVLYKLNWLGEIHMIASAESIDELLKRKVYLERILKYDRQMLNKLIENKNQHTQLLNKLKSQQREKLALEKEYKNQIKIVSDRKNDRKKILADIRNKKSFQVASVEALQKASEELDQAIKSLTRQMKSRLTPGNMSGKSFSAFKGLLKLPVRGKIVSKFGPYKNKKLNVMHYRNGIDIAADRGEPVRAVRAGNVLYAGWFKGYGNLVILDHGDRYYTVYAHADEIFKQKGEAVETHEVIAIVGDTGSLMGPELYFEVRHKDKPVDPLKWLENSR